VGNIENRQLSPDGYWWWNGHAWEPVTPTAARAKTNRLAIAAFVSSLACIPYVCPLNSIAAVVLGIVELTQLGGRRPYERGIGLAVAGLVIGGIVLVLAGAMAALLLFFGYECRHGC